MSEFTMDRLRENLEALKMKNTLEILDNYLERAVADKLNIGCSPQHIGDSWPVWYSRGCCILQ